MQTSQIKTEANRVWDYNQPPASLLTPSLVKWLTQLINYSWLCLFIFKGNRIKPHWLSGANSTWYEPNVAPKAPLKEHTCRHRHLSTNTHTNTPNPRASSPPHVLTCANYIKKKKQRERGEHTCPTRWFEAELSLWQRLQSHVLGGKHHFLQRCKAVRKLSRWETHVQCVCVYRLWESSDGGSTQILHPFAPCDC